MDWERVLEAIGACFVDIRLPIILGMIVVDLVLGIAAALRGKVFSWDKVGQFYSTNVLPYGLGYIVLYTVFALVPGLQTVVGEGFHMLLYGALMANLLASVAKNVGALGLKPNFE